MGERKVTVKSKLSQTSSQVMKCVLVIEFLVVAYSAGRELMAVIQRYLLGWLVIHLTYTDIPSPLDKLQGCNKVQVVTILKSECYMMFLLYF